MRIFVTPLEAVREIERDLFEMGIEVHPQTMQDKDVEEDEGFKTKEVRAYGYKLTKHEWNQDSEMAVIDYLFQDDEGEPISPEPNRVLLYIAKEHEERWSGAMLNPGTSWLERKDLWDNFIVNDSESDRQRFHYTYSERFACQAHRVLAELKVRPDSRQAIMTIHSNINSYNSGIGANIVEPSQDYRYMGGLGRIPCSMYYQFMIREGHMDLIYTMRSCDFLTHFPIDMMLALRAQKWMADKLELEVGDFTHFMGSLHAYKKDMDARGIF